MRDTGPIGHALADLLQHGPIRRDGEGVGFWHVLRRGAGDRRRVCRLWRAEDGTMLGDTAEIRRGAEDGCAGGTPEGFGRGLAVLMDCAGLLPAPADRAVASETRAAILSEVLRMHPGIDYGEADRIAGGMVPEGLAEAAASYVARLDATGVSLLLRHPRHGEALGRAWDDLTLGGDAPLVRALDAHPGFPGQVLALHGHIGADGLGGALANGTLGSLVAGRLVAEGVPRCVVPLAGRAEAALSDMVLATTQDPAAHGRAVRWTLSGQDGQPWPVRLAMLLVGLPDNWAPRDAAGWRAFALAAPVVGVMGRSMTREALPGVLNAGDGWDAFLRRLMAASGTGGTDGVLAAMEGVDDMAGAYAAEALIPAAAAAHPGGVAGFAAAMFDTGTELEGLQRRARSVLFDGRSLARRLGMSADWHRRQHGMRAAMRAMPGAYVDTAPWPAGLPDAAYGDVAVAVLRDPPALEASASNRPDADGVPGLDNCAAGYAGECREGGTRVLELRRRSPDGRGPRLSMAEVDACDAPRLRVVQHVGPRNGPAAPEAERALDAYLADVASGRLAVDLDAFEPMPDDGVDEVTRSCGFHPADDGTRLAVTRLWDRYLPGPWRGVDPVEALRRPAPEGGGSPVARPAPHEPTAAPPVP